MSKKLSLILTILLLFGMPLTSYAKFFIYKYRSGYPMQQVIAKADEDDTTILFVDSNNNNSFEQDESVLVSAHDDYVRNLRQYPPKSRTLAHKNIAISKNDLKRADRNQDAIISKADSNFINSLQIAVIGDNNEDKIVKSPQTKIKAIMLNSKLVIMDNGDVVRLQEDELKK